MNAADPTLQPKTFAVIGAGPVGSIVAAHLAHGGYKVVLCDIAEHLLDPAQDPGIILEGRLSCSRRSSMCVQMWNNSPTTPRMLFSSL